MTFLEKAFLLNEEFQKEKPRSRRMSRHLYDLEKLMDTKNYGKAALEDTALYQAIVEHPPQVLSTILFRKRLSRFEVVQKYNNSSDHNRILSIFC